MFQEEDQQQNFQWYFIDKTIENEKDQIKGPVSLRDLDVLYRTNSINSSTLIFKDGMKEWQQVFKVDILKKTLMDANNEIQQVQKLQEIQLKTLQQQQQHHQQQQQQDPNKKSSEQNNKQPSISLEQLRQQQQQKQQQQISSSDDEEDDDEYVRTLHENPEKALEQTIEELIKKKYYKQDGLWHIYDEQAGVWKTQIEEPINQIKTLKEDLLVSFKLEILNEDATNKTKKEPSKKRKASRDLTGLTAEQIKKIEKNKKKTQKQKEKKKLKMKEDIKNTFIYVTRLPEDITEDELDQFFSKAGMIRLNAQTGTKKIKIYKDEQNQKCTGDALIQFQNEDSVNIALDMLNERYIRQDSQIFIEKAKFQHKENFLPKETQKIDKIQLMKLKQQEKKMMGWEEEDQIKGLQIVIIKGMFTMDDVEAEGQEFFKMLNEEVKEECSKIGSVQRIKVYQNNPQGYIQVKFSDSISAEECIKVMNGRFFDGRQLECFFFDGTTDYNKTQETKQDEEKRIADFGKFLENQN